MIPYRRLSLYDREWVNKRLKESDFRGSEYCFANQFLWGSINRMEVACVGDALITIYRKDHDNAIHDFPVGAAAKEAVKEILKDDKAQGKRTVLRGVLEAEKGWLEEKFPDIFSYTEDRNSWDYLYPVEALKELTGRRYHSKRNHIARFKEQGEWSYEAMTSGNQAQCRNMYLDWLNMNRNRLMPSIEREKAIVNGSFLFFEELGLEGGILKQNGEVVGFCIGEPLNSDTFIVHIEKAYTHIQGAYPMINQQFVIHNMEGYRFVNREDDMGQEGLRKAKLSYHPEPLLVKYWAKARPIGGHD